MANFSSFACLILVSVQFITYKSIMVVAYCTAFLIYASFMWFRDVIDEAEKQGHHTLVVQIGHRYGMTLFIASEVMFFVAWFWAFLTLVYFQ